MSVEVKGTGWVRVGRYMRIRKQGPNGDLQVSSDYPGSNAAVEVTLPAADFADLCAVLRKQTGKKTK